MKRYFFFFSFISSLYIDQSYTIACNKMYWPLMNNGIDTLSPIRSSSTTIFGGNPLYWLFIYINTYMYYFNLSCKYMNSWVRTYIRNRTQNRMLCRQLRAITQSFMYTDSLFILPKKRTIIIIYIKGALLYFSKKNTKNVLSMTIIRFLQSSAFKLFFVGRKIQKKKKKSKTVRFLLYLRYVSMKIMFFTHFSFSMNFFSPFFVFENGTLMKCHPFNIYAS